MSSPKISSRTRPCFQKETPDGFYHSLKEKAAITILKQRDTAKNMTWMKIILYPALYASAYCLLIWKGENMVWFYTCYACMGLLSTLIVFNIVHDAIHHSLFSQTTMNNRAALLLDVLGGNSFVWRRRHVIFHHSYTNIVGWDIDIPKKVCRFNENQEYKSTFRFQVFYMPVLYLLYSLNWIFVRDFKDFFQKSSCINNNSRIPKVEFIKLFLFKIFHAGYIIVLPVLLLPHAAISFVMGLLLMHGLMSALTLLVLLPSHLDEDAQFPQPDENMMLPDSWAMHQLKVTNDFGTNNRVMNFIMGGLNHHIAHHLFPQVNHNIIPGITKLISETASERKLPYKCFSLREVIISHVRLLKKKGQLHHFLEE